MVRLFVWSTNTHTHTHRHMATPALQTLVACKNINSYSSSAAAWESWSEVWHHLWVAQDEIIPTHYWSYSLRCVCVCVYRILKKFSEYTKRVCACAGVHGRTIRLLVKYWPEWSNWSWRAFTSIDFDRLRPGTKGKQSESTHLHTKWSLIHFLVHYRRLWLK